VIAVTQVDVKPLIFSESLLKVTVTQNINICLLYHVLATSIRHAKNTFYANLPLKNEVSTSSTSSK
jgi:hypothetical protein